MNKKNYMSPLLVTETKFLMKETLCEGSVTTGSQTTIEGQEGSTDTGRDDEGVIGDGTGVKGRGMDWGHLW